MTTATVHPAESGLLDFVVAGAQKCGTTTLYAYLDGHPSVSMANPKETHFFDTETTDWSRPDYARLHSLVPPGGTISGEATPVTLYWLPAHERLRAYNPHLKIILLFRDPIDRAYSNWRMVRRFSEAGVTVGGQAVETLPFGVAIRDGRRRMAEHVEVPGLNRWWAYVERGLYAEQVRHFRRFFPAEQFLLLNFDDIRNDPSALLARVAGFLDIDPDRFTTERLTENLGGDREDEGPDEDDIRYLSELYRDDLVAFQAMSGLDLSTWRTWRAVRG
ncbi:MULTISPECIES: sulfotransferase family protein [Methylorubrum]|uniref:sulfotransferase family protein n=1 Tax=Methylorubrum TaxID=2282523 RepID=UPI00209EDAAD|nr:MULTISPECIES: sulfotransferase domain-containing protein [Methylorubrum]MCP1550383.1 hypothetical protein [Methylorubrum zatmanii]MCP1553004.1 hypothetical protein [Methylorubrum extorquens]MCP1580686.1 hypothetical protein [Methylorubrum extorquens]